MSNNSLQLVIFFPNFDFDLQYCNGEGAGCKCVWDAELSVFSKSRHTQSVDYGM